jgi:hypothetical protein
VRSPNNVNNPSFSSSDLHFVRSPNNVNNPSFSSSDLHFVRSPNNVNNNVRCFVGSDNYRGSACLLLSRWFLLYLLSYPEDGGDTFLRNVCLSLYTCTYMRCAECPLSFISTRHQRGNIFAPFGVIRFYIPTTNIRVFTRSE